jgi:siroheme synthase
LTVKGLKLLGRADVIVYDQLAGPELLKEARPDAEIIYVGKKAGDHTLPQGGINQLLVDKARAGLTVVRLKGGDPFVFGRGGEEAEALAAAGIPFEIVPGVTSAVAVPAYAGIPVTHRAHTTAGHLHHRPRRPHQGGKHHPLGQPGAEPRHPGLSHGGQKFGGKLPAAGGGRQVCRPRRPR